MPSITLGDVKSRVYSRLDNNTALYPPADMTTEINDCFQCMNLLLGTVQSSVQVLTGEVNTDPSNPPLIASQLVYPTPAGMIFPVAVSYEGRDLVGMSLLALASQYRSWATDVSAPTGRPVKEWSPIGFTQFVIHPMDGLGGRSLVITGVMEPALLVNDNDPIPMPDDDVDDMVTLVGSVMPIREGGQVFAVAVAELYSAFIVSMKRKAAYTNLVWPTYYSKLAGWKPYTPSDARLTSASV